MTLDANPWMGGSRARLLLGVSLGERSRRLKAALLRCRGEGWSLRVASADAASAPAPPNSEVGFVDAIVQAIHALAEQSEASMDDVEVIGVDRIPADADDGLIAALLAERTGVTVVTGFSYRAMAMGSAGEPIAPVADWLLYRSARRGRLLLHLGGSLRVTWLPASAPLARAVCFDAGPCCEFLDGLTLELSNGKCAFDPSGHFAVQGHLSEELLRHWSGHPFLLQSLPRFLGPGDFDGEFQKASLAIARELRLSARDVLCTANHFIVRSLCDALRRLFPVSPTPVDEAWASGGGSWNGFLWKLLQEHLAPLPTARTDELGIPAETRAATHAALFAYFVIENLASVAPGAGGNRRSAVLGQITPGSPDNWDRVVCNLADRLEFPDQRAA